MIYVLDCNVALKWFLPEPLSDEANRLLARFRAGTDALLAPDLLLAEFGYTLRKRCDGHTLTSVEVREIWEDFLALGLETVPISTLVKDAMGIALTHMGNFYDAVYVALARDRGCSVVTADDRMGRAFGILGCITRLGALS